MNEDDDGISPSCGHGATCVGDPHAVDNVKIMIPGTPGNGFDSAACTLGEAMQGVGLFK